MSVSRCLPPEEQKTLSPVLKLQKIFLERTLPSGEIKEGCVARNRTHRERNVINSI